MFIKGVGCNTTNVVLLNSDKIIMVTSFRKESNELEVVIEGSSERYFVSKDAFIEASGQSYSYINTVLKDMEEKSFSSFPLPPKNT